MASVPGGFFGRGQTALQLLEQNDETREQAEMKMRILKFLRCEDPDQLDSMISERGRFGEWNQVIIDLVQGNIDTTAGDEIINKIMVQVDGGDEIRLFEGFNEQDDQAMVESARKLAKSHPNLVLFAAKVHVAKYISQKQENSETAHEQLNHALMFLEALSSSTEWFSCKEDIAFQQIVTRAQNQAFEQNLNAMFGITLGMLAKSLHLDQSQAVSAEGVYRSSLKRLTTLSKGGLRFAVEPSLVKINEDYASLLSDWENREGEATTIRDAQADKQQSLILGHIPLLLYFQNGWGITL